MAHSLAAANQRVEALVFTEAEVDRAKATLLSLLEATVIVRGTGKDADGSRSYEEVPDNPVRLAAAVKIIEFGKGKPRQIVELPPSQPPGRAQTMHELARLLAKDPQITRKVVETLEEAAKFSQAIPVESVKPDSPAQPLEKESGGSPSGA